jgi:hypothetical protein
VARRPASAWLVLSWNVLGLCMLVNTIAVAATSTPGPLHLDWPGTPFTEIVRWPLVWLAAFLAPLAVLLHVASLQQTSSSASQHSGEDAVMNSPSPGVRSSSSSAQLPAMPRASASARRESTLWALGDDSGPALVLSPHGYKPARHAMRLPKHDRPSDEEFKQHGSAGHGGMTGASPSPLVNRCGNVNRLSCPWTMNTSLATLESASPYSPVS